MSKAPKLGAIGAVADTSLGFRNRILNGAMSIDQRNIGAAQTFTAAAALAYCVDRWYGYCTGAGVTGQRVAGASPNQFNYRFTGAASVTKIGFAQRIEAANCQDLAGTTATLSVDLANSLLTTVTWTAWRANATDAFGTLAAPTRTQIATGTITVNSTLTRYSVPISIPGAATTGIEVEFSVGAQVSGTWTIGRAQLEAGGAATPFEVRPIGMEISLCQRYYQAIGKDVNNELNFYAFANAASVTSLANVPLLCEMRGTPIVTKVGAWSGTNTNGQPVISTVSKQRFTISAVATAAGMVQFNNSTASTMHITADAEL